MGDTQRKKKTLSTGTGRKDVPHIPEYEDLEWLNTYIEHRETIKNTDQVPCSSQQITSDEFLDHSDKEQESSPANKSDNTPKRASSEERFKVGDKRPWTKFSNNSLDQVLFKTIGSISKALDTDILQFKEKELRVDNEDELFCKSSVPQLETATSVETESKIEIQQILFNYEFHQQFQQRQF